MSSLNPMFRSEWGESVFRQKYNRFERWEDLAFALAHEVCDGMLPKSQIDYIFEIIRDMKFIPGGRYLYYAGRAAKFYNNCGHADTRLLTDKGWVRFGDVAGQTVNVFSPADGLYHPAVMHAHGVQPLQEIVFAPVRGRSDLRFRVKFTPDHKWLLTDGTATTALKVGDVVPANAHSMADSELGFAHGFVFGDGNRNGQLRLCNERKRTYLQRLSRLGTVTYPPSADGDPVIFFNDKTVNWKELPTDQHTPGYIASFIEGWLAADSCEDRQLTSVCRENLEWFREHAAYAGITVSGALRSQVRDVSIGKYTYAEHEIFLQNYARGEAWAGYKVVEITSLPPQEVFCPFEPIHNRIVIDHNIDTYQCFLLRAETDTRQDWADLSWKSESCLMTGGGIGIDYSVYRPEGAYLSRTGGTASGPLPKIQMINEIGRHVMQGGSRRSAIYASLNWQHADAGKFLVAKDWHSVKIPGTDKTLWDVRALDFNFPAPLDMTNISLNYDDDWLETYNAEGVVGETFAKNMLQACSSGEPGFSFNFGAKSRETLRNACCEVTSEDDSDCCNLGSLNYSRIENIAELESITEAATMFLLCGSHRSDVPYEKVRTVREQNRRLGLGVMGVHEWLMARGYKYKMTSELRDWMTVYEKGSDAAADKGSAALSCSRPKGVRAIAPTGTIGILAGTTTGIEPLYAVAYKRRVLTNGTEWVEKYVVDDAANVLIHEKGTDPDSIETSVDLAKDPERRISFQYEMQKHVDQAISSTINLPQWGSEHNNLDTLGDMTHILAKYAHGLRGFTCYPDAARGGQPLVSISYEDAMAHNASVETHDICEIGNKGGVCGV